MPPVPKEAPKGFKQYAVWQVGKTILMRHHVASLIDAIQSSKTEAYTLDREHEIVPLELRMADPESTILIDHRDGVLVFPEAFARNFRKADLGPLEFDYFDI